MSDTDFTIQELRELAVMLTDMDLHENERYFILGVIEGVKLQLMTNEST